MASALSAHSRASEAWAAAPPALGPGRLPLQQLDGLGEDGAGPPGVALVPVDGGQPAQGGPEDLGVAGAAQVGDGLLVDGHRLGVVARLEGHPPGPDQQVGALGVAGLAQLHGLAVVGAGPVEVEVDGAVPGQDQEAAGRLDQLVDLGLGLPGRPGVGQRLPVVVGDHLGQVPDPLAGHRLDPLGDRLVAAGPTRPGDLGVGDVPDQGVPEHVLVLVLDRGGPGPLHQLLALQLGQPGLDVPAAVHGRQRPRPEHPADHGGVLDQGPDLGGEGVEAGRDQPVHGLGDGDVGDGRGRALGLVLELVLGDQALVGQQAGELLGVQRVAAGPLQQQGLHPER
jgi:hypothetical protein